MAGHISYPRTAAVANAWSDYRHAIALANMGATAASIAALRGILNDPNAPAHLKDEAARLLRKLYAEAETLSPEILVPGGGLDAHEGKIVGHTLLRHVALPGEDLSDIDGFLNRRNIKVASIFADRETAEIATKNNIEKNNDTVRQWLSSEAKKSLEIENPDGCIVGFGFERGSALPIYLERTCTRLVRDKNRSEGYFIVTSFPCKN